MKSKTLIALGLCAVSAAVFTGCSTQKTVTGRNNSIGGGLVEFNTGSYIPSDSTSLAIDGTKLDGRVNPSGDQVKLFWGLISYNDF